MSKESKKKIEDDKDYSFIPDDDVDKKIDEKIAEQNNKPEEISIEHIQENMPEPGYMETVLNAAVVKGQDESGEMHEENCVSMEITDKDAEFMEVEYKDGKTPSLKADGRKVAIFDPVFRMDLREHAEGQISDCASTVFPQIMDEGIQIALDEKKQRGPEQRKSLFNWWWVILLMIMIPVIILTLSLIRGGGGG